MSAVVIESANGRSVPDEMSLLLREYTDRLQSLVDHAVAFRENSALAGANVRTTDFDSVLGMRVGQIRRQIPLAEDVVRTVSQYVYHGKMDETTRLLLELRLRELESTLNYSQEFADNLASMFEGA